MRSVNPAQSSLSNAYMKAQLAKRADRDAALVQIYRINKNGQVAKTATTATTAVAAEKVAAEIARLESLNPGVKYVSGN